MPKVSLPQTRAPAPTPAPAAPPPRAPDLRERLGGWLFGGVVALAGVVAAAAWIGGSLGAIGERAQAVVDDVSRAAGLTVSRVVVIGLDPAVEERVRAAAGVGVGATMLSADPHAIRDRLAALDAVGGVSVHRLWPDQLTILAETRIPLALWESGGALRVIDQHGRLFSELDADSHLSLMRVSGESAPEAAPALAARLAATPELARRVVAAERVGGRRWDLRFTSGVDASLPEDALMDEALAAINLLHAQNRLLDLPVAHIDARHPDRLAVRPIAGRAAPPS
jgi:cell division protein FtsQ